VPVWLQTPLFFGYEWIRDWQILIAGALLIWTLRACSREIRQTLRAISKPETPNQPPGMTPFEQTGASPSAAEIPRTVSTAESTAACAPPMIATRADVIARLVTLRNAVRQALAEIPSAGGSIGGDGAKLYRKVMSISLDDINPADHFDHSSLLLFQELQAALTESQAPSMEAIDTKTAWEWLVRVNTLARKLQATAGTLEPSDAVWTAPN